MIYIICIILKKFLKYKNKYLNGGNRGICDKKSSIDEKIKKVLDKKVTLDKSIITKNGHYFTDIEEIIITNNVVEIKPEVLVIV